MPTRREPLPRRRTKPDTVTAIQTISRSRRVVTREHLHESRLPAPVLAEEAVQRPGYDLQGNAVIGPDGTDVLVNVPEFDAHRGNRLEV